MVGKHGVDMHFGTDEAVAVQRDAALDYRIYGEDKPREREVGESLVGSGHGRARAWRCTMTMAATVAVQCGLT